MNDNSELLDGITVFVSVVDNKSFNAAAAQLKRSSSFISKEVNRLESRLGVRLLNRTTRSLSLTPDGESFYQTCQQIVEDANQAQNMLTGTLEEPQGKLKVACPISFGLNRLAPIIPEFRELYPKISLDLDLSNHKVDIIAEGFDIAIRASNQLEDSSLISRRFLQSEGVTLAAPSYLEKYGTPRHPNELVSHKTISYSNLKKPTVWQFVDQQHKTIEVDVKSAIVTNSAELELALCLNGEGILRLPRFNIGDEIETGKLVPIFNEYIAQQIDVFLVYPSRKHMAPKVRCFIDFVLSRITA